MEKIKLESLMIDDYVTQKCLDDTEVIRIDYSDFSVAGRYEYFPLPITREILVKNHFDPMDIAWWDDVDEDYNFVGWHFVIKGIQFELDATFEYVYQLQQAIRLSGLNVEVVV